MSSCTNCDTGGNKLERVRDLRFLSFSELWWSRIVSVGIYILNPARAGRHVFPILFSMVSTEHFARSSDLTALFRVFGLMFALVWLATSRGQWFIA